MKKKTFQGCRICIMFKVGNHVHAVLDLGISHTSYSLGSHTPSGVTFKLEDSKLHIAYALAKSKSSTAGTGT